MKLINILNLGIKNEKVLSTLIYLTLLKLMTLYLQINALKIPQLLVDDYKIFFVDEISFFVLDRF